MHEEVWRLVRVLLRRQRVGLSWLVQVRGRARIDPPVPVQASRWIRDGWSRQSGPFVVMPGHNRWLAAHGTAGLTPTPSPTRIPVRLLLLMLLLLLRPVGLVLIFQALVEVVVRVRTTGSVGHGLGCDLAQIDAREIAIAVDLTGWGGGAGDLIRIATDLAPFGDSQTDVFALVHFHGTIAQHHSRATVRNFVQHIDLVVPSPERGYARLVANFDFRQSHARPIDPALVHHHCDFPHQPE